MSFKFENLNIITRGKTMKNMIINNKNALSRLRDHENFKIEKSGSIT